MNIVYILVSSKDDFITEQAILSIFSLKYYNPTYNITLLTDASTSDYIKKENRILLDYADCQVVVEVPQNMTNLQKSRFIKTKMAEFITEDFIYLDTDTIITGNLDEIRQENIDILAAPIVSLINFQGKEVPSQMPEYCKITGLNLKDEFPMNYFHNSGVIVCRNNERTKTFFKVWHHEWLKSFSLGFYKDQPSMWLANYKCSNIIRNLKGEYNCRSITPLTIIAFFGNCKIFHYFASSVKSFRLNFKDPKYLNFVRENGLTEKVIIDILNIKNEFKNKIKISVDKNFNLTIKERRNRFFKW